MNIDISKRDNKPMGRKVTLPSKKSKQIGISFTVLAAVAVIAFAVSCFGQIFIKVTDIWLYELVNGIGQISVPIACFLAAKLYNSAKQIKPLFIMGIALIVVSHFAFVYFYHGRFTILNGTSFALPVFLGCAAIFVRYLTSLEDSMKSIVIFLLCLLAWFGSGGSVCAVWVFIFGCGIDKQMQVKFFLLSWAVMFILGMIYAITQGYWYIELYRIGALLAVPLIMRFKEDKNNYPTARYAWAWAYPAIIGIAAIVSMIH
jgi:hypothetical protein